MLDLTVGREIPTREERLNFLEYLPHFPHVAIDVEKDPITQQFLGIACAYQEIGMFFPIGLMEEGVNIDDELLKQLMTAIEQNSLRVAHNAAYDLEVLTENGFPMEDLPFVCTMIMAHMVDENVLNKKLDFLHKYYTGGIGKVRHPLMQQIIDTMGWRYVPAKLMSEYGYYDAVACSQLFSVLEPKYKAEFGELF